MKREEKIKRLKSMLGTITAGSGLESLIRETGSGLESMEGLSFGASDANVEAAFRGVKKVERDEPLSDDELFGLEAIILPRERPAVFIRSNTFDRLPNPWTHFATGDIRRRIEGAIPAIGRIELPGNVRIPFGGTGFVVGEKLIMTNRHVAELFANGLGLRGLAFRNGHTAAVDFKRENGDTEDDRGAQIAVREIVMIHPFWDMAILRVEGLPDGVAPLTLSLTPPDDLVQRQVAVIGYPARDERSDLALQDQIFERVYNVKRLQPGEIRARSRIRSFQNEVNAMTHDSSTLGGNSGSAVLDVTTGHIIGLHFAGIYLKANYAVPAYELARDARVVNAGVRFTSGSIRSTDEWLAAWRLADGEETTVPPSVAATSAAHNGAPQALPGPASLQFPSASWTLPLQVTVSLGGLAGAGPSGGAGETVPVAETEAPRLQEPIMFDGLEERTGYNPLFLALPAGAEVPLPELTAAGKRAAAKLEDDTFELKYHKFSIVMHKRRRMALFTAANVDWRTMNRKINGRKPTRSELTGIPQGTAEQWVTDPRIPQLHQLPDEFYTKDGGAFDKGHLVRRDDVCWGDSFDDIQMANGDTYHTTNCSPQIKGFNQSPQGEENWGDLENLVQQETKAEKIMLFSGPVLAEEDLRFEGTASNRTVRIQIPSRYWKIVVAIGDDGPQAFGFVLEQDLSDVPLEFAVPAEWERHLKPIGEIEELLGGLVSLDWLKRHDQANTDLGRRLEEAVQR